MPLISLLLGLALSSQQEIPAGIRYKKAPDAVNKLALGKLEKFFASDPKNVDLAPLGAKALVVGPGLWSYFGPNVPDDLKKAMRAEFHIPGDSGVQVFEGRVLKTEDEQSWVWLALLIPNRKIKPTIRKANAEELQYYWAIIPYDIEEPLYVADFPSQGKFLFDFDDSKTDPRIFHVDRVMSMKKP